MKKLLICIFLCMVMLCGCSSGSSSSFEPAKGADKDSALNGARVEVINFESDQEGTTILTYMHVLVTVKDKEAEGIELKAVANEMSTAFQNRWKVNDTTWMYRFKWDTKKPIDLKNIVVMDENEHYKCSKLSVLKKLPKRDYFLKTNDGTFVVLPYEAALNDADGNPIWGLEVNLIRTKMYTDIDEDDDRYKTHEQSLHNVDGTFEFFDLKGNPLADARSDFKVTVDKYKIVGACPIPRYGDIDEMLIWMNDIVREEGRLTYTDSNGTQTFVLTEQ